MKAIKTFPSTIDAELAKVALVTADVPAVVVGVNVGMEGGAQGVQLLVPEQDVETALLLLKDL